MSDVYMEKKKKVKGNRIRQRNRLRAVANIPCVFFVFSLFFLCFLF